jgi:biopolymer transport protein TolQ
MGSNLDLMKILLDADLVVKFVLLVLFLASIFSWSLALRKKNEWKKLTENNEQFLSIYKTALNLHDVLKKAKELPFSPFASMFIHGYEEFLKLNEKIGGTKSKELLQSHFGVFGLGLIERSLDQGVNETNEKMEKSLPFLANIGSVCPFIGLFGTVWGIVNSFVGIASQSGGGGLDSVAPGLAEALVATAVGLFAAIPAVIFYNYFTHQNAQMNLKMASFGKEFLNMVERSLVTRSSN